MEQILSHLTRLKQAMLITEGAMHFTYDHASGLLQGLLKKAVVNVHE